MTAPMVKLLRDHAPDCPGTWMVDRQRPVEQCDTTGRRSHVGGSPHLSMRCTEARGCTARAMVKESALLALLSFTKPTPRKRSTGVKS